ncbi:gephyrin-like molybdotransferase Glp [Thermodesulfobacterium hydrogeniphilum]|uniref:molybdopterin molybdotransferase MoeA n=1 Tax=Thermodesulfobacterium hydrogeniphilum TaxID=161156 RepID=UPI00056F5755|nr:gephyrin-like molybdotransferase Glp [Thermodesulfobacterium hydrogeniphilum]
MLDKGYLSRKKALELLLSHLKFRVLEAETIPIEKAYGRVVYEDIKAPEDLPGFERSTVDGYAVNAADTFGAKETSPTYLTLKGEISMGEIPSFELKRGECAYIHTGGMLPPGANAVVMVEHTSLAGGNLVEIFKAVSPYENVILRDEDAKKGEVIIPAGKRLKPQDIGALAGLGISEIKVVKKPKIAIILTGDEIIPHTEKITPGKVRDINSFTLSGLIDETGGVSLKMGIVEDNYEKIKEMVQKAYELADIILITGGTSAGTKDMTAQIINELGKPGILFHGVSIKPGKPIIAGICNDKPVFGLPGHPVAVYICFDLFVKPVIEKMMGLNKRSFKPKIKAKISKSIYSQAGRTDFIRVFLEKRDGELWAVPLLSKSGLIMSLVKADGLICIPENLLGYEKGKEVEVELI